MAYKFKTFSRVPKLAYKALHLADPAERDDFPDRLLELGTFRPIENEAAVLAIVDAFIRELIDVSYQIHSEYEATTKQASEPKWSNLYDQHNEIIRQFHDRCVLSHNDFIRFVGHEEAEQQKLLSGRHSPGATQVRALARQRFADIQIGRNFTRNFAGYLAYLEAANQKLYDTLQQDLPALVPEEPRQTHSYIVSKPKTGKTELLKAICLNYVRQPDYAGVVVLDPGGEMAPQMARWLELIPTGQLVWRAPIGWSNLIVSALWAFGPLELCFRVPVVGNPMRCAV